MPSNFSQATVGWAVPHRKCNPFFDSARQGTSAITSWDQRGAVISVDLTWCEG